MRGSRSFTTYLNIKGGDNNTAELRKMERQAQDSLLRVQMIAQRAQQAMQTGGSATAAVGGVGAGAASAASAAAAERARGSAIQRTVAIQNAAAAAALIASRSQGAAQANTARAAVAATASVNRLTGAQARQAASARVSAAATGRMENALRLASTAANVAQGPLGPVAGRLSAVAAAMRELGGIRLGLIGAGAGIAAFTQVASSAQDLRSKLQPLFETQQQVNKAFMETQYIAKQTRMGLEPVIDLYSRLTLGGRDMGLSQQRISRLTESAALAARLSGGNKISQDAGLYQFAQGIGSGTLAGDELKSIRENTMRLAKAIADGMGVPIGKLKELGAEGKLTPKVIADAMETQVARLEEEIKRVPPSISAATTQMGNAFISLITDVDQATGVVGGFSTAIMYLADNLPSVVQGVGQLALAYGVFRVGGLATGVMQQTKAWNDNRVATAAATKEALRASTVDRQAAADRVKGLRQVRESLRANITEERKALQERNRAVREAARYVNTVNNQGFSAPNPRGMQLYNDALRQAKTAADNLNRSKTELTRVQGGLVTSTQTLRGATERYRQSKVAAANASRAFANAARGLWTALNPLGIALSVGISLLISWAFQASKSAQAADKMAEAQVSLSRVLDEQTGKLITNNQLLIANNRLKLEAARDGAKEGIVEGRRGVSQILNSGGNRNRGVNASLARDPRLAGQVQAQQGLNAILADFQRGTQKTETILERLDAYGKTTTNRLEAARAQRAYEVVTKFGNSEQTLAESEAGLRGVDGKGTAADARLIFGNQETVTSNHAVEESEKKVKKAREERDRSTEEAAKRERLLQSIQERGDKRNDTLGRYEDTPKAVVRAQRDVRELSQLVGQVMNGLAEVTENNPLGAGIYTQEMANGDRDRIEEGLRRPIREALTEMREQNELLNLRAAGYSWELDALEKALELHKQTGAVTSDDLDNLLIQHERQKQINEVLARREALTSQILSISEETKSAFEDTLVSMRHGPLEAIKSLGNTLIDNVMRVQVKQFTDRLFGDSDAKLKALVEGKDGVQEVQRVFAERVGDMATTTQIVVSANDNLANSTRLLAEAMDAARTQIAKDGALPGSFTGNAAERGVVAEYASTAASIANGNVSMSSVGSIAAALPGPLAAAVTGAAAIGASTGFNFGKGTNYNTPGINGGTDTNQAVNDNQIEVTAKRNNIGKQNEVPTARTAYGAMVEEMGSGLDKVFKSGTFFSGIGKGVGKALGGAAEGTMASSLLGLTGLKQSSTGAAIGGAIGSFIPIPGMGFVGGMIGGTIGGMFSSAKRGSAIIGGSGAELYVAGTYGNNKDNKAAGTQLAGGIIGQLDQIANALGANLTASAGSVSIGVRDGKYRVDTLGRGYTKLSNAGVYDFGEDEEAAVRFAITDLIKDGVLTGISNASINILKAGKDLQKAIEKAAVIESIPKRLMQLQNPVLYAVTELNREFADMISYLKEGGATTQQFADAQRLYELERAAAIEQASRQATSAIQAFLDAMTGSSNSPLSKRTVYNNAEGQLNQYRADIRAGRVVDEGALLTAAQNFQDASRSLYGSSQEFFSDFDDIFALLSKAKNNSGLGSGGGIAGTLPSSPFEEDSYVKGMLDRLNASTQAQTNAVANRLDTLIAVTKENAGPSSGPPNSSINRLPGFRSAA